MTNEPGPVLKGSTSIVSFGLECDNRPTALHELGHAMGYAHEQQRPDRFAYINPFFNGSLDNYTEDYDDLRIERGAGYEPIGSYDVFSIMQYSSGSEKYSPQTSLRALLPAMLDRHQLTAYLAEAPGTMSSWERWNTRVRINGSGIDLARVFVADVDSDRFDDLVLRSGEGLVWSRRGRTGWVPLRPGGQVVQRLSTAHPPPAPRREIGALGIGRRRPLGIELVGSFDAAAGTDVLQLDWHMSRLLSSSGREQILPAVDAVDVEVVDLDGNGFDDVFFIDRATRAWRVLLGGASFNGIAVTSATGDPLVSDVEVVELAGRGTGLRVVAFRDGVLQHIDPVAADRWRRVFPSGRGPLPARVQSLADVEFVHLNGSRDRLAEPIDILTYSDGRDGLRRIVGEPIVAYDALGSTASTCSTVAMSSSSRVAPELRSAHVAGYFAESTEQPNAPGTSVILTLREISFRRMLMASDILALGTVYRLDGPVRLENLYPMPLSESATEVSVIENVLPREHIELQASFLSPGRVGEFVVQTERIDFGLAETQGDFVFGGTIRTVSSRLVSTNTPWRRESADIFETFSQSLPGDYRVRITPATPSPVPYESAGTWIFRIPGNTCGDEIVDPGEECDDGNADEIECTRDCRRIGTCGDGIVQAGVGEQCDHGLGNIPRCLGAGECTTSCRYCLE